MTVTDNLNHQTSPKQPIVQVDIHKPETFSGIPVAPETIEDIDGRQSFLEELLLKILYLSGPLTLPKWGDLARLKPQIVEELFRRLRTEQLCEVTGMVEYAGPAPVSLESYVRQVRLQSVRQVEVHPPAIHRAFAHMVLDDRTLTQLGTALNSGGCIFLYGPTGAGKTTIAEVLPRVLAGDRVWIPYAVEIDGQVISVYDPLIHKTVESAP